MRRWPGGAGAATDRVGGAGRDREHVVGKGDTLYSIAWRHGIDYRALAGANSIRDPYIIHPGQVLLVRDRTTSWRRSRWLPPQASGCGRPGRACRVGRHIGSGGGDGRGAGGRAVAAAPRVRAGGRRIAAEVSAGSTVEAVATETASTSAGQPTPAARTVAGMRWTRPASGKTISTFGRGGNKGIDIGGAFEQPVRAAAPGRVVYAGSGADRVRKARDSEARQPVSERLCAQRTAPRGRRR